MKLIKAITNTIRPNTWIRIWGEMVVAAALSSYPNFNYLNFVLVFIATSPLLWSSAYILNDLTDIKYDKHHPLKKHRPIASGELNKKMLLILIFILTTLAFIIGFQIKLIIFIMLLLLSLSQIFYTLPYLRLKELFLFDVLLNLLNSGLRYLIGWYSQSAINPFFISPLILFILIKLAFFPRSSPTKQNFGKIL